MALTTSGFTSGDNYSVGMAKNVDAAEGAGSTPQSAGFEKTPANHPITGTSMPESTGAGKGSIRTGRTRG